MSSVAQVPHAAHAKTVSAIGYALTLGLDGDRAVGLSRILLARLTEDERAALAYAALLSMDHDDAYQVASLAIFGLYRGEVVA